jgi:hypothetical protein
VSNVGIVISLEFSKSLGEGWFLGNSLWGVECV